LQVLLPLILLNGYYCYYKIFMHSNIYFISLRFGKYLSIFKIQDVLHQKDYLRDQNHVYMCGYSYIREYFVIYVIRYWPFGPISRGDCDLAGSPPPRYNILDITARTWEGLSAIFATAHIQRAGTVSQIVIAFWERLFANFI
jgi:hypothetical protein